MQKMNRVQASNFLDALASQLGANSETRRKWRERKVIAARWHAKLLFAAGSDAALLPPDVFDHFEPDPPCQKSADRVLTADKAA